MRTKMTLLSPSPNQIRAIGNKAIEGRGLNIDVRISRKSAPIRVALANAVKTPARIRPARYPFRSSVSVNATARNSRPDAMEEKSAATVSENVGKRRGFPSHRAYASQAAARTTSRMIFRSPLPSRMNGSALKLPIEKHFLNSSWIRIAGLDLRLDAAGLRCQQKDACPNSNGLRNRVCHKQNGELRI